MSAITDSLMTGVVLPNSSKEAGNKPLGDAWVRELEKQIYKDSVGNAIDHSNDRHAPQKREGQQDDKAQKQNIGFQAVGSNAETSLLKGQPRNLIGGLGKEQQKLPVSVSTDLQNTFSNSHLLIFSSTLSSTQQVVNESNKVSANQQVKFSAPQSFNEVPAAVITQLADGELLVRSYAKSPIFGGDLDKTIKYLTNIVGKEISQLRINGNVVWVSAVKNTSESISDGYRVNLIY